MGATNLDATAATTGDLQGVLDDGVINEDVMQKIWDISKIPLPLTDLIGTGSASNPYKSWVTDKLAAPILTNKAFDGEDDFSAVNQGTVAGQERIGNHCQEPYKVVKVSERARNVDTIGRSDELAYQIMMRQQELRRDVEASINSNLPSVEDEGEDTKEGQSAGFYSFIRDGGQTKAGNALVGATSGAAAGFANGIVAAPVVGDTRALSELLVRDAAQLAYDDGGDPYIMMSTPTVIRKFSEYLFTSSARIASLMSDTGQEAGSVTAKGSVNVFVTDFGINLELTPNRLQLPVVDTGGSENAAVGIIDPNYIELAFLNGYTTDELAKTGLADKRLMHCDFTLCVKNLDAHATILDIDYTADVVAA